jgi:hypothetical protein
MITNDELKWIIQYPVIDERSRQEHEICTELLALREQTRWRKYPDEKPKHPGVWLITYQYSRQTLTDMGKYSKSKDYWCSMDDDVVHNVIAFMELPEPLPSAPDAKVVSDERDV